MKALAIVTAAVALALVPVTLFAAFRPAPAPLERIIFVPMADIMPSAKTCTKAWEL
jgi:hypothetical protein